jgi:ketosteroid isomerase-like protein
MSAETMRKVAEAFAQADLKPLFASIADNIVWKSASSLKGPFLFGGTYTGRMGVVEVTSQISTAYLLRQFRPREIVSHGDVVWGLFDVEGDYLPSGGGRRPFQFECAVRWRMQGEKVIEHQSFFDTEALLRQTGGEARA